MPPGPCPRIFAVCRAERDAGPDQKTRGRHSLRSEPGRPPALRRRRQLLARSSRRAEQSEDPDPTRACWRPPTGSSCRGIGRITVGEPWPPGQSGLGGALDAADRALPGRVPSMGRRARQPGAPSKSAGAATVTSLS